MTLQIVKGLAKARGFVLQARRWVVERTIAWLCRNRRVAKDYEEREETTEAWMYPTMIRLILCRMCPDPRHKAYVRN